MKTLTLACLSLPVWAALLTHAQTPTPQLLGAPAPAVEVVPAPETTLLHAVSDDGRWLLFTSASDRLVAGDFNATSDVFLLDRTTGQLTLISANPAGRAGNGTSVAAGLSADGRRVAFLSRASDLVPNDTNHTWDVFVHDVDAATTRLISAAENGGASAGPALDPWISADGRHVIFRSPARDLAPASFLSVFNLYRRDLFEGRIECLTTNVPSDLPGPWRLGDFAVTSSGGALAMSVRAVSGANPTNLLAWLDLASGQTVNCTAGLAPEFASATSSHTAPALSADGRFVAFRSQVRLPPDLTRYGLNLYNVAQGTTTLLTLRTNKPLENRFPDSALNARLSANGAFVVYATPTPPDYNLPLPRRVYVPSQVYLYDVQADTTTLVSAAPDGSPASADCLAPVITPDGRGVAFVSRATNLVAGAGDEALRVYWYNREAATLSVMATVGDAPAEAGQLALSLNGDWLAAARADRVGPIVLYNTRDGSTATVSLTPTANESSTGRGWSGVRPEGVSADGRYVALSAFPAGPTGTSNHMQVYLHDTQTGTRRLLSEGVDGQPANGHPMAPWLTADATRVFWVSAATNLVAGDNNGVADVFGQVVDTGARQVFRQPPVPDTAPVQAEAAFAPTGNVGLVSFVEAGKKVGRFVDLNSGVFSAAFSGAMSEPIVYSRDGSRIAFSRTVTAVPMVEIYDPRPWLADPASTPVPLWTSGGYDLLPALNALGSRVAFFRRESNPRIHQLLVMDWASNTLLFSNLISAPVPEPPVLSAEGRFVVWLAPGANGGAYQVWRADVDAGTVALVSVAADGASEANGTCRHAALSADGRYVAFASLADNLVANDTNGAMDVFLRDLQTGRTLLLSRTPGGEAGHGWSLRPVFSADGRSLFFLSHAPDLAAGDFNEAADLFKVEMLGTSAGPLLVLQRNLTTGRAQLLWNGSPGKRYAVEFTDEVGTAWVRLPGDFAASEAVEVDPTASARRFFRVVELP